MVEEDSYIYLAIDLDRSGLIWQPEIGDEVVERHSEPRVSILVDPQGLKPAELREVYVWLPTLEQLIAEIEDRAGAIYHLGINEVGDYEAIIRISSGLIEVEGENMRVTLARGLQQLIAHSVTACVH